MTRSVYGCTCEDADRKAAWSVLDRNCNHSAFNGYKRTTSDYSSVKCGKCGHVWRTKAAYVRKLPNGVRA